MSAAEILLRKKLLTYLKFAKKYTCWFAAMSYVLFVAIVILSYLQFRLLRPKS